MSHLRKDDFDNDGTKDIIMADPESPESYLKTKVHCVTLGKQQYHPLTHFWHLSIPKQARFYLPIDYNEDGHKELPAIQIEDGKVHFVLYDLQGQTIENRILPGPSVPIPSGEVSDQLLRIADLDNDGVLEFLYTIDCLFNGMPRGILCYDPKRGVKKWEYLFGPTPFQIETIDLDSDGSQEIIFSAWAPHNGISFNGMDDDHSYIGVLNCRGELLWSAILGGFYTMINFKIADIDMDGHYEIITARSCHRAHNPDPGEIRVYDALSGTLKEIWRDNDISFSSPFIADLDDKSPGLEVIAGDSGGSLRIFSSHLKPLSLHSEKTPLYVLGVEALIPGGPLAIFAWTDYTHMLVFDRWLKVIFSFDHKDFGPGPPNFLAIQKAGGQFFFLNADKLYGMFLVPKRIWRGLWELIKSSTMLLIVMAAILNISAWRLWRARRRANDEQFSGERHSFASAALMTVQEITHKLKSPLFTIQLETEKLLALLEDKEEVSGETDIRQIGNSILEDVRRMKSMFRVIMKLLDIRECRRKPVEVNSLVRRIVERYEDVLKDRIFFELEVEPEAIVVNWDEDQMDEALTNIIDNAVEALPQGGKIRVSCGFARSPAAKTTSSLFIEVEDNGIGISKDKLEEIFKPNFSTKKDGMGLGLTIAQRIVEAHGGKIEVTSREKIGTRIAIIFPWKG